MLFYYVQIEDRHDPVREKASVASINEAEGFSREEGALRLLTGILGGRML